MMNESAEEILDNADRRNLLLKHLCLNGIDYVEVPWDDQQNIHVYFIKTGFENIPGLTADEIQVAGGVRIRDIAVERADKRPENPYLEIHVNKPGDFSPYTLIINSPSKVDPVFSSYTFSFKAGFPGDLDFKKRAVIAPVQKEEPLIDYLAKDYSSFRQALIDLIPSFIPDWRERHEADLGITLIELLAYVGDQLSYYQDAVANEAYLETARQRESVKRHARLIDYHMHEGANARTFVHFQAAEESMGTIPDGTCVISRVYMPFGHDGITSNHTVIPDSAKNQALSATDVVFETVGNVHIDAKLNSIRIHTWGSKHYCLPKGTTSLCLIGEYLPLEEGDLLLFEEVKGLEKDLEANMDHRQVVRLTGVNKADDPLMKDPDTGKPPLRLTKVAWHRSDALQFPLWISYQQKDGTVIEDVSLARGNLVLADHGQTVEEWHPADKDENPKAHGIKHRNIAYRFALKHGPMTFHTPKQNNDAEKHPVQEMMYVDPKKTIADCHIEQYGTVSDILSNRSQNWEVVPHLMDSNPFHRHFVVETRNDGRALIRFGDGNFGMKPSEGSYFKIIYRIGNGNEGNVSPDALAQVIKPSSTEGDTEWPDITTVRNPLPAWGGTKPETIDQVKLLAPKGFHAEQFRAVTEQDYVKIAEKHPEVTKAVASFRWTGSWYTVFIQIDPRGMRGITPDLEERVRSYVSQYLLAGYDIKIAVPVYVPLEIGITVRVSHDHFQAYVKEAVLDALSCQEISGGQRGFFHPDNFTFGQPVYLSQLYQAIKKVEGVDSAEVTAFKRLGARQQDELENGYIPIGKLEIACLDNDPNFPENGVLHLNMIGEK